MLDRSAIQKILLIRLSAIGDVVNTLPALTALRRAYPAAHLAFLVEDKAQELVVGHPDLDEVIVFERKRWRADLRRPGCWRALAGDVRRHISRLRAARFDVLLDFQGNLKSGLHARLAGVPVRIGFAKGHSLECNHWFSTLHVTPLAERENRVEKFLGLLRPLGVAAAPGVYRLPASAASEDKVARFLRASACAPGGYVVLHPGTSEFGRLKRWPLERFAELAARIVERTGLRALIAWGPGERALAEELASRSPATIALETRSLLDLAELLRNARAYVGADSGPLHLASAVGVPSVALFGPKDPAIYGPYNPARRVLYHPQADPEARMEAIGVDEVFEALVDLLGAHALPRA